MKSIRWKLTLSYFILSTITLALTGVLLIIMTEFFARQFQTESLRETAGDLLPRMQSVLRLERDPTRIDEFIRLAETLGNVNLRFVGREGEVDAVTLFTDRAQRDIELDSERIRFRPPVPSSRPDLSAMIDRMLNEGSLRFPDIRNMPHGTIRFSFGGDVEAAYLEISDNGDLSGRLTRLTVIGFLIAAAATLGASALVGVVVGSSLTRPIVQLTNAVETMHQGDMLARAEATSNDEIGTLGRRFNDMADRLSDTIGSLRGERDSLKKFLADASHELRTPLTAMTTFVELLQREADSTNQVELLSDMKLQTERMGVTVSSLLMLSRLDAGVAELMTEDVAAEVILREAWDNVAGRDQKVRMTVTDESDPNVGLLGDRAKLVTLFENLFANSLNSIGGPGTVQCQIHDEESGRVISVMDHGTGINPADLPHVFERFYRSKGAAPGGAGLGLSIAESIARAHGGIIAALSPVPGHDRGAEIRVTLPLGLNG